VAGQRSLRVLYSFPHKLGADRICYTAWQQVNGLAAAGAELHVHTGVLHQSVPKGVKVSPTLARGKLRISYKMIGTMRACILHDYIVSRRIEKLAGQIDIIHAWPLGALRTLKTAQRLGIPTVLERPNAHTRYAYEVVMKECERIGVALPLDHEHAFKADVLEREEAEYMVAGHLLCPSDFVVHTFKEHGFSSDKLVRHQYGFDERNYFPDLTRQMSDNSGLTVLFVGGCAPRKGLHFALEAWLQSSAHVDGTFLIAGSFVPGYAEKISSMLSHPSVHVLGFRKDVPELMRKSDVLVLPTIEEGSALVTFEARGSGCVLLVSEATGAVCKNMENGLIHRVGDVTTLAYHMSLLNTDRFLLQRLRASSLSTAHELTWSAAGHKLLGVYRELARA